MTQWDKRNDNPFGNDNTLKWFISKDWTVISNDPAVNEVLREWSILVYQRTNNGITTYTSWNLHFSPVIEKYTWLTVNQVVRLIKDSLEK